MQPVGGEEELIAGQDLDGERVDLDPLVDADGAGDGVLLRDLLDLLARELAALDELVEDGVIFGDLLDAAVAQQVDAAVADVGDEAVRAVDQERRERGAHAALLRVGAGLFVDLHAGALHRLLEQAEDGARGARLGRRGGDGVALLLELLVDDADRERAGDLAGGVAAHAVRHHEQAELAVDEEVVLVVIAQAPDVGGRREPDGVGQCHARERLTEPTRRGHGKDRGNVMTASAHCHRAGLRERPALPYAAGDGHGTNAA